MFDLIIGAVIAALAGATAAGATIAIIELTLNKVLNWFSQRKTTITNDRNLAPITVLIQDAANSGNARIVQGVFHRSQRRWVESHTVNADRLDSALASRHRNRKVVEYASYEY